MVKNYLKIAFRNLLKYKLTSSINLLGLTIGLTCCFIILIYILNELSYDKFNLQADRIYRVTRSFNSANGEENLHLAAVAPPFGPLLKNDFPEIEKTTTILDNGLTVFQYKEKIVNESKVFFADNNFFDFFSVPLLKGNPKNALQEPNSVLLNEAQAKKYFGDQDPINQLVRIDNQNYYKVTGVFQSFPSNSHFHPEILISFNTLKDSAIYGERNLRSNWGNNSFQTYLMLKANYPAAQLEAQFPDFIDRNMPPSTSANALKKSKFTKLHLQKLTDIHLHSSLEGELEPNGNIKRVYIFSCIALVILLIACINYMNLSTARSVLRSKEIGIRKAIGANRKEIIIQFLSESVLITFISILGAILLTFLVLPSINTFSDQQLSINNLLNFKILALTLLLPFAIGFISGIYPALFLSSFEPVKVLKGILKVDKNGFSFRKILVVSQFSVSIILIVATIVVFRQLNFMKNTDLGFNKECVIATSYPNGSDSKYESFRNDLLKTSLVKHLSRSSRIPTGNLLDDLGSVSVLNGDSMQVAQNVSLKFVAADHEYLPTFGIKLLAGRNFDSNYQTDSNNYILNEAAIKKLGLKDAHHAIGKDISYGGVKGKIIGVTQNFHFESMHKEISPLILNTTKNFLYRLSVKIDHKNIHQSLEHVEKTWASYFPQSPFHFSFLDEALAKLYKTEQQQSALFFIFSFIAIFIACLGLFGLTAFTITQRIKEIGIRKVLGANIHEIIRLLSLDFIKLIIIAALISLPLAWYIMDKWLQDFAYRISIPLWAFAVAALAAILIAFITISSQAIKAAIANPVKSLRTE